jgi:hypothetical protein
MLIARNALSAATFSSVIKAGEHVFCAPRRRMRCKSAGACPYVWMHIALNTFLRFLVVVCGLPAANTRWVSEESAFIVCLQGRVIRWFCGS